MDVKCHKCGQVYDDAESWTICPHNPLYRACDEPLCRVHDLFNCRICKVINEPPAIPPIPKTSTP